MILENCAQAGVAAPEAPGQSTVSTGRSARSTKGLRWTWGCGIIMLVGGVVGMALMRPERETMRWANEIPEAAISPA